MKNGNVRPHGARTLSATERRAIEDWLENRRALMARRELDAIEEALEVLGRVAHLGTVPRHGDRARSRHRAVPHGDA